MQWASRDTARLEMESDLARRVDRLTSDQTDLLRQQLTELDRILKRHKTDFSYFSKTKATLLHMFMLILLCAPALLGYILHAVPVLGASWFTRSKVKHKEFALSILLVSSLVLTFFLYLIFTLIWTIWALPGMWFCLLPLSGLATYAWFMLYSALRFTNKKSCHEIDTAANSLFQQLGDE